MRGDDRGGNTARAGQQGDGLRHYRDLVLGHAFLGFLGHIVSTVRASLEHVNGHLQDQQTVAHAGRVEADAEEAQDRLAGECCGQQSDADGNGGVARCAYAAGAVWSLVTAANMGAAPMGLTMASRATSARRESVRG